MDFYLSKKEQDLKIRVYEFASKELASKSMEIDRTGKFPWENVKAMADRGLFGLPFPEEYGGSSFGLVGYCIALEELARACRNTATINLAHTMSAYSIHLFGNDEQKNRFLKPMVEGRILGALAVTERTGGSDVASIRTEAKASGDEYIINGEKSYITNAGEAQVYLVLASTDKSKGAKGLSVFIIEKDTGGLSLGGVEDLTGFRAISNGQILFEDCRVPRENLVGGEGEGLKIALSCIDRGRVGLASIGVGLAQAALDASVEYSKKRSQFGRSLSEFQAVQFMIADIATETEAARLLTYYAASKADRGDRFTVEAAMAKLYSSEAAMRAALKAIQIHGGYGLSRQSPVERMIREAKALAIMEGTSEIQRMVIARGQTKD
ncbi:MAG: acyl-CoA dehydrogenase family protein [Candidatus Bathyarchaeia archaeon]|nr:acyl-CoA dehydrogenase family protein [Candidatus Bathyarchaeota archaeon]